MGKGSELRVQSQNQALGITTSGEHIIAVLCAELIQLENVSFTVVFLSMSCNTNDLYLTVPEAERDGCQTPCTSPAVKRERVLLNRLIF